MSLHDTGVERSEVEGSDGSVVVAPEWLDNRGSLIHLGVLIGLVDWDNEVLLSALPQ